jgi:hypothetical protein
MEISTPENIKTGNQKAKVNTLGKMDHSISESSKTA